MKICAITMVYRDHWALGQWYRHFARDLGGENLFVVAHGPDPAIAEICPEASVITIPRDRMARFDAVRSNLLNHIQRGLNEIYDWVIRTDADELVVLDPHRYASFEALLRDQDSKAVFALGMNIAEQPGDDPLGPDDPVFPARRTAVFSGHYSKAWAVRGGLPLIRHGVAVGKRWLPEYPFALPAGVYMAHLKFANQVALDDSNRHRRQIASRDDIGLPGSAWQKPVHEARKFYAGVDALPQLDWPTAEAEAYAQITTDPVRDAGKGVLRARNVRFDFRTTLPDWFGRG
ncbi:glycosyltransferase family 2 protein [Seohaeicola saemankumensis]|nr:glycosyltransferase family 2 protein [Seohaeicola saemankumensis]MCA0869926.1 glycosyltransferase family 2 protein [Seohaeicola saemankumensis]